MIAGFETPSAGTIKLNGEDVTRAAPFERDLNTVFQDYALFPHMTVEENVGFGLRVSGVKKPERARRVAEALEGVRLSDRAQHRPQQLSGGQQQRVALARALVKRPSVLLLDEPLGALDLKLREEMQFELRRIQRGVGITFVFVTHDQGEALAMSDRVAVFCNGRIEQIATPRELYRRPATTFVAGFVGSSNLLPRSMFGLTGSATTMVRPEHITLRPAADATPDGFLGHRVEVTVADIQFLGSEIRVVAMSRDGVPLIAVLRDAPNAAEFRPGDPALAFIPSDALLELESGPATTSVDVVADSTLEVSE
jgi:putative spermidine/putrescine transport system ATP-binding protein